LLVIFGIALLVFGPKKLPELGKGIGKGIRGFKSATKDHEEPSDKITNQASDSRELIRTREARMMQLPAPVAARQAAEYYFGEDFRGHVTTTPSDIEIFGWRSRDHFIHRFSCCD
jgi:sec-independent protein translocase protein TatA